MDDTNVLVDVLELLLGEAHKTVKAVREGEELDAADLAEIGLDLLGSALRSVFATLLPAALPVVELVWPVAENMVMTAVEKAVAKAQEPSALRASIEKWRAAIEDHQTSIDALEAKPGLQFMERARINIHRKRIAKLSERIEAAEALLAR